MPASFWEPPRTSPEQARGKAVDKRTDIWAFGCVLYEMLTAKRLLDGETVSDTLAAVLKTDPDWSSLPLIPESVRRVMKCCLERDPKRRLHFNNSLHLARKIERYRVEVHGHDGAVSDKEQPARGELGVGATLVDAKRRKAILTNVGRASSGSFWGPG